jgi:hypothetical protein
MTQEIEKRLPEYVIPAATGAGLPATSLESLFAGITTGNFNAVPGFTAEIGAVVGVAVQGAYSKTFFTVFSCTLPFGALAMAAASLVLNVKSYFTDDVARRLHGSEVP